MEENVAMEEKEVMESVKSDEKKEKSGVELAESRIATNFYKAAIIKSCGLLAEGVGMSLCHEAIENCMSEMGVIKLHYPSPLDYIEEKLTTNEPLDVISNLILDNEELEEGKANSCFTVLCIAASVNALSLNDALVLAIGLACISPHLETVDFGDEGADRFVTTALVSAFQKEKGRIRESYKQAALIDEENDMQEEEDNEGI